MFRLALFAFALGTGFPAAHAAQIDSYTLGNWAVGAYTDDTSGSFSYCLGSARYNSGITLGVTVSRDFQWDLFFTAANWRMWPGERISVQYRFDRTGWTGATVEAVSENTIIMPMPTNGPVAQLFRRSRMMEISDGSQSFYFDLTGTSRLLVSLVQCVESGLNAEQMISRDAPIPTQEPNLANLRLEGTRVLSNFLLAAEFPSASLLSDADFPKDLSFAHAIAIAGNSLGFAVVVPDASRTPDLVSAQIAGSVSENCQGQFGSGTTTETVEGVRLVNSFAVCQVDNGAHYLQYVVVSRKPEGQYVIGIFSQGLGSNRPSSSNPPVKSERLVNAAYEVSQ